ncbi:MAG: hypothetical protein ABRQ38_24850, partial [Candidatus Eremiobacterota bacterium]
MKYNIQIAEKIANEWNKAEINYAVAHGIEQYPSSLGRDLDVIVCPRQIKKALEITLSIFREERWIVVFHKKPWVYLVFAFKIFKEKTSSIEIDLFS